MYPLFILAFIGFLIFVERILYMRKERVNAVEFLTGIKSKLAKGNELEALTITESTPGIVARLSKEIILSFVDNNSDLKAEKIEVVKQSVVSKAILEIAMLQKNIYLVGLFARLFPILGLLGTLLAILEGFSTMIEAGPYASISLFSNEMFNAIISSVMGLSLFFAFLIFHHILKSKVRASIVDMQWAINDLIVFMLRGQPQNEELYNKSNG